MFQPVPARPAFPCPLSQTPVSLPSPPPEAPVAESSAPEALPPEALRALDALFGSGRVVAHRACFGRLFGGAACGILLSQFWFWTGTPTVRERTNGWFWKPQREITEETGLSRAETATARRRLCAQGVLEEKRCGIPATLHFRLDMAAVMRRLWAYLQAQPAPPEAALPQAGTRGTRTLVCSAPAHKSAGIAQSTSEIISEKTQEKTQTRARPLLPAAFAERVSERRGVRERSTVTEAVVRGAVVRGAVVRGSAVVRGGGDQHDAAGGEPQRRGPVQSGPCGGPSGFGPAWGCRPCAALPHP